MFTGKIRSQLLVVLLFLALGGFSIARFLSLMVFNPDSTGYVAGAQNFIRTGHMVQFANAPSQSMLPAVEPYTEQPSGYPLFLVPFFLVFRSPVTASAMAQSFAILIFYAAIYMVSRDIGAGPLFQAMIGLVFTLFRSLQYIFATVESETLFIGLSLLTVHFLVASKFSQKPRLYWVAALMFAACASLTRAVGVFMLGVFILVSWQRTKSRWLSIALSFVGVVGPMIAWSIRNLILYGRTSMTHVVLDQLLLDKTYKGLKFLLGSISSNPVVLILILVFCLLCVAAPVIGPVKTWIQHLSFTFNPSKVRPFTILVTIIGLGLTFIALAADKLGIGHDPQIGRTQVGIACIGLLFAVLVWPRTTNLDEYFRAWKANYDLKRWEKQPLYTFGLLVIAGVSHFVGIFALSLVTPFSALEDRYLSPSLVFLLFSVLAGMNYLIKRTPGKLYPASIYGIALVFILLSPFFLTTGLPFQPGIRIPPEQALWKEMYALPGIDKVSHYYTDNNFTHEIFGNRPQRIFWNESQIAQPGFLSELMATGQCPFILVTQGNKVSQLMQQYYKEAGLIRMDMLDGKFVLFAQPCLLSP